MGVRGVAWREVNRPELSHLGPHDALGRDEEGAGAAPVPVTCGGLPGSFLILAPVYSNTFRRWFPDRAWGTHHVGNRDQECVRDQRRAVKRPQEWRHPLWAGAGHPSVGLFWTVSNRMV